MYADPSLVSFDAARTYLDDAQCVLFTARQGDRTLRCYVTRSTLNACFGVTMQPGERPAAHSLRCYDAHAARIQRAARCVIEGRHGASGAVIVTLASALVAGSHV